MVAAKKHQEKLIVVLYIGTHGGNIILVWNYISHKKTNTHADSMIRTNATNDSMLGTSVYVSLVISARPCARVVDMLYSALSK